MFVLGCNRPSAGDKRSLGGAGVAGGCSAIQARYPAGFTESVLCEPRPSAASAAAWVAGYHGSETPPALSWRRRAGLANSYPSRAGFTCVENRWQRRCRHVGGPPARRRRGRGARRAGPGVAAGQRAPALRGRAGHRFPGNGPGNGRNIPARTSWRSARRSERNT